MSMHNRAFDHSFHRLHARQGGGQGQERGGGRGGEAGGNLPGTGNPAAGGEANSERSQSSTESPETTAQSSSSAPTETTSTTTTTSATPTTTSATSTSTTPPTSTSTSISTPKTPTSTPATRTTSTTSELSTTATTSSSLSSSSSQSSTSRSSAASIVVQGNTLTAAGNIGTGTFTAGNTGVGHTFLPTSDSGGGAQSTETSAAAVGGSLNTGAVAGGVIGGLAGVAVLVVLFMFFIRRNRAKDHASEFDAAQFRRSAMIMEDPPTGSNFPSPDSPPPRREMIFQGRDQVASVRSSMTAGMAGQGAWGFRANANQDDYQQYDQYAQYLDEPAAEAPVGHAVHHEQPEGKNSAEYYSDSFAQQFQSSAASASTRQPIQARQQYRFGEAYGQNGDVISDDGHLDRDDIPSMYSHQTPRQSQVENPFASTQDANGRMYTTPVNPTVRNSTATLDAYGGI